MTITKPSILEWFLDVINIDAGEWVHYDISFLGKHIYTLNIPPFRIGIGDWIESALDVLLWAINASVDAIWDAIRIVPHIPDMIWGVLQYVYGALDKVAVDIYLFSLDVGRWIANSAADTLSKINDILAWTGAQLWQGIRDAKKEVMDWTPGFVGSAIAAAFLPWRWHLNILTNFGQDIIDLFKDPEEWLLDKIESMLVRFL